MCFHGLGHGVLAYTEYDLEKAVAMCKKAGTTEFRNREYIECTGGAVMEMISGVHDRQVWEKQVGKYFRKSDPLYPCNSDLIEDQVKPVCYVHLTPHLFTAAGGNLSMLQPPIFSKAMSFCDAISKDDMRLRNACFGGFGKEYTVLAKGRDIRDVGSATEDMLTTVRGFCASTTDVEGKKACNESALSSLFWGGESNPDASFTYCAIAEGEEQSDCYHQLLGNIVYFHTHSLTGFNLCQRLPEAYRAECIAKIARIGK